MNKNIAIHLGHVTNCRYVITLDFLKTSAFQTSMETKTSKSEIKFFSLHLHLGDCRSLDAFVLLVHMFHVNNVCVGGE